MRLRIGSRAQVMHGTAKMTSGGLTKKDLKYNKRGKIVSKKASKSAKISNNLVKAGYVTEKGKFGLVQKRGGSNVNKIEFEELKKIILRMSLHIRLNEDKNRRNDNNNISYCYLVRKTSSNIFGKYTIRSPLIYIACSMNDGMRIFLFKIIYNDGLYIAIDSEFEKYQNRIIFNRIIVNKKRGKNKHRENTNIPFSMEKNFEYTIHNYKFRDVNINCRLMGEHLNKLNSVFDTFFSNYNSSTNNSSNLFTYNPKFKYNKKNSLNEIITELIPYWT